MEMIWSSVTDSANKVLSRLPTKSPPKYMLYVPGALPMKPISAMEGLPQEFGHPVILITMSSSINPHFSSTSSSLPTNVGRYRSASAKAKGHVGNATQATMFRRMPLTVVSGVWATLYSSKSTCTADFLLSGMSVIRTCWLHVIRKPPPPFNNSAIFARPVRQLALTRPMGTKQPQCHMPSSVLTQPYRSLRVSNLYGLAGSSFLPRRSSTCSRKKSGP
mmetsp:Transcript_14684/g.42270  ORF Transcript_14684/g.42270 Transcript_14684/m.42270 type:complete len:219 (-) Transcript_14684:2131-2787(-)